jgi:hypothetical protein
MPFLRYNAFVSPTDYRQHRPERLIERSAFEQESIYVFMLRLQCKRPEYQAAQMAVRVLEISSSCGSLALKLSWLDETLDETWLSTEAVTGGCVNRSNVGIYPLDRPKHIYSIDEGYFLDDFQATNDAFYEESRQNQLTQHR